MNQLGLFILPLKCRFNCLYLNLYFKCNILQCLHLFREGDNAIIGLDGKPPLHWRVSYSLDHNRRDPEYFEQYADAGAGFYDELEQHTPMHPLPGMVPPVVGHLPRTVPFPVHVSNLGNVRQFNVIEYN